MHLLLHKKRKMLRQMDNWVAKAFQKNKDTRLTRARAAKGSAVMGDRCP